MSDEPTGAQKVLSTCFVNNNTVLDNMQMGIDRYTVLLKAKKHNIKLFYPQTNLFNKIPCFNILFTWVCFYLALICSYHFFSS